MALENKLRSAKWCDAHQQDKQNDRTAFKSQWRQPGRLTQYVIKLNRKSERVRIMGIERGRESDWDRKRNIDKC